VLVVALALRLGAALWWESRIAPGAQFAWGDSYSYWVLAEKIARGEPYEYGPGPARIFRTPGYPLVLSVLFAVSGDPPVVWARIVGCLLGTATVGGVIWLTSCFFSERASIIAGLLAALYPGAIGMSVFVLSEALFCPLMLGQVLAWIAAYRSIRARRTAAFALIAGVLAGLATLVRPSWLLFTPFACGLGIVLTGQRRRQFLIAVAMAAGIVVTMLPWWVRNYGITGKLTLTTTQFGASLYDGLNPNATGASDMQFVGRFVDEQRQADATAGNTPIGTFEERLDNRIRDAAVAWVRQHPGQALQLAAIKVGRIWSPWPNAPQFQDWRFQLLILGGYLPLIVLAVWGAIRFCREDWSLSFCVLPAIYFTLLHAVFIGSIRYRQPPMLPLIVLAAAIIDMNCRNRIAAEETTKEPDAAN
jgi:4-amino-4-deoxy-L-arabinose transferase-like glycosyltransferase